MEPTHDYSIQAEFDFIPNLQRAAAFTDEDHETFQHVYLDKLDHGDLVAIGASETVTLVVPLTVTMTGDPGPMTIDAGTVLDFYYTPSRYMGRDVELRGKDVEQGWIDVRHGEIHHSAIYKHNLPFYETWREDTRYDELDNMVVVNRQALLDIVSFFVEQGSQTITLDALSERMSIFSDEHRHMTSLPYTHAPAHHTRPRMRPAPRALTRVSAEPLRAVLDTMTGEDVSLLITDLETSLLVRDVQGVLGVVGLKETQTEETPGQ